MMAIASGVDSYHMGPDKSRLLSFLISAASILPRMRILGFQAMRFPSRRRIARISPDFCFCAVRNASRAFAV